jgi:murein L,D-transpeptidase YcbB/YkuD
MPGRPDPVVFRSQMEERDQVTPYERRLKRAQRRETRMNRAFVNDPDFEGKHPRAPKGQPTGGKFIRKGMTGAAVRGVQRKVGTKPDADYGDLTAQAVRRFQQRHGLTVDGVVGRQTAMALLGHEDKAKRVKIGAMSREQRAKLSARGRAR